VYFNATYQLLIIYSAFAKYLRKVENTMKQCISYLHTSGKLVIQSGEEFCKFGIPVKLVRAIQMCLNETYSRVRVGKHLSDVFTIRNGLKQGDALLPLLFNFGFEYTIRRGQVNRDGLKLTFKNRASYI
jgi:hypothetical protein